MNFEYIKNVDGLGKVYKYCNNAEELAISMPYLSEFASRKSAEIIAKYVYSIAHAEEMERLDFFGILQDPAVKGFLSSKSLIDAFHFIRQKGNDAVHKDDEVSADEAIDVLDDLHYVLGEVAIRLGMIIDYPEFDEQLIVDTGKTKMLDMDTSVVAKEMYDEYIVSKYRVDRLRAKYEELTAKFKFTPGDVELHERIEFHKRPKLDITLKNVIDYFGSVGNMGIENCFGAIEDDVSVNNIELELSLKGEQTYETDDLVRATKGILYDLENAEAFSITSHYSGETRAPWFDTEHQNALAYESTDIDKLIKEDDKDESLLKKTVALDSPIHGIDAGEEFKFTRLEFLYNHGGGYASVYENGKWIDLGEKYSSEIINKDYGADWWNWEVNLNVEFDYDKYGDVIEGLHDAVRRNIPDEELEYCEQNWMGEDSEPGILLDGIQWCPRDLKDIQTFLDEINRIIKPIKSKCLCYGEGAWYMTKSPFAVAELQQIDGELVIVGTEL